MTQNIIEEFWKRVIFINPQNIKEEEIGVVSDDNLKWLINTTLKEIEEECEKKKTNNPENLVICDSDYDDGYNQALDDTKQLIHQKLIK